MQLCIVRSVCIVRKIDRVRKTEIRKRGAFLRGLDQRVEESVVRSYGHVERIVRTSVVKKEYESDYDRQRRRGKTKEKVVYYGEEL